MGRKRKTEEGSSDKYGNRYTTGVVEKERVDRVVAFKPKIEIADALFADMEARKMTPTQWLDMVAEKVLRGGDLVQNEERRVETGELSPVLRDAILIAIAQKEAALRAEKKQKRPDQAQIERWESQIEELEALLEG